MELSDILSIVSGITTALSLVIGVYIYKKQASLQTIIEYTKRYEEIVNSYPLIRLNTNSTNLPPESTELSTAALRYLNLCCEEFYLHKEGYLSNKIWNLWKNELERTIGTPLYKREWPKLEVEFERYLEFRKYVESIQKQRH